MTKKKSDLAQHLFDTAVAMNGVTASLVPPHLQAVMEELESPAEPDTLIVPDSFGSPESSSVIAAQYDANTQTLIVDFKGGKRYGYGNIKPAQWVEFYQADSKGGYFNKHIRPLAAGRPL